MSGTHGYIEFSDGGSKCASTKHGNTHYKTYALKDCPAGPIGNSDCANMPTKPKKACFDFKYDGGCTGSSAGFCVTLKGMSSVDGNAVRARHHNGGNCGLSFDSKNWNNQGKHDYTISVFVFFC